jgi:hypothetical protein
MEGDWRDLSDNTVSVSLECGASSLSLSPRTKLTRAPNRSSCVQIKGHAQKIRDLGRSTSAMIELEQAERAGTAPRTPDHVVTHRARTGAAHETPAVSSTEETIAVQALCHLRSTNRKIPPIKSLAAASTRIDS